MFLLLSATYLSPRWGLSSRGFGVLYTFRISIALAIRSLDPLWGF